LWIVNLGCIDLNPHPVRADDLEHPDELRVDLDPGPGTSWDDVRRVALIVREVLDERGLSGWPKTSGSRGMHVYVRIARRWSFDQVRRATLALAREVERRAPELATSKWWKEERHGVFLDYNQNAKDRTVASAWSVRPTPDARVSMPLEWGEVADCDPAAFTLTTAPARLPNAATLPRESTRRRARWTDCSSFRPPRRPQGSATAPWPPHYKKQEDEPPRVMPSRRKRVDPAESAADAKTDERPAPIDPAADHGGQGAAQRRSPRRSRAVEGASSGGGCAPAAGRRADRFDARPLVDVDAHPGEPAPRARGRARRRGSARSRLTIRGAISRRGDPSRARRRRARARRPASPRADRSGSHAAACRSASARTVRRA
jgi:hypothetical protein